MGCGTDLGYHLALFQSVMCHLLVLASPSILFCCDNLFYKGICTQTSSGARTPELKISLKYHQFGFAADGYIEGAIGHVRCLKGMTESM